MIYENIFFFMINLMSSNYSFSRSLNVLSWFNERQERKRKQYFFFLPSCLRSCHGKICLLLSLIVQFRILLDTHFYLFSARTIISSDSLFIDSLVSIRFILQRLVYFLPIGIKYKDDLIHICLHVLFLFFFFCFILFRETSN